MKTLVLNGTARKGSETEALLGALLAGLSGEVHEINAFENISACTDCRYCRSHAGCSINDAMQDVYKCIDECNNVVIASPVYFGMLTPPLLAVQSRFQAYYSGNFGVLPRQGPRKRGAILITAGGYGGHEAAEKSARTMLHVMNAEWVGTALAATTDSLPAAQDDAALLACAKIAENLNPAD